MDINMCVVIFCIGLSWARGQGMRVAHRHLARYQAPPPSEPQIAVDGAQPRRSGATVAVEFVGIDSYTAASRSEGKQGISPVDMAAAPMCRWLISSVGPGMGVSPQKRIFLGLWKLLRASVVPQQKLKAAPKTLRGPIEPLQVPTRMLVVVIQRQTRRSGNYHKRIGASSFLSSTGPHP
jgi:hypothetical protein